MILTVLLADYIEIESPWCGREPLDAHDCKQPIQKSELKYGKASEVRRKSRKEGNGSKKKKVLKAKDKIVYFKFNFSINGMQNNHLCVQCV